MTSHIGDVHAVAVSAPKVSPPGVVGESLALKVKDGPIGHQGSFGGVEDSVQRGGIDSHAVGIHSVIRNTQMNVATVGIVPLTIEVIEANGLRLEEKRGKIS